MKNKYKKIILIIILFFTILGYTMVISIPRYDEIWEYGYAYNIATGLIPYKDFNMVSTPLYPFIVSIFIKVFGHYLLSAHIFNAIIITIMLLILYKMLGKKSFILVPLIFTYSDPTYNNLLLFFFFLLLYIKNQNIKDSKKEIITAIIISLMFLTKQSVGVVFFILELFLSKHKIRYIITFIIPILILIIYLTINNALYNFIDYTLLGLFDFAGRNGTISIYLFISIIICITLIILYKKYNKKEILYALAYQIISFPIFDEYHTIIAIIPFIFILLNNLDYKEYRTKYFITMTIFVLLLYITPKYDGKIILNNNYMFGRKVNFVAIEVIDKTTKIYTKYEKEYDKIFNFTRYTYLIKIYQEKTIDKYDMVLNGNMGYKGHNKYIKEIDNYCNKNKCLFIISTTPLNKYSQQNYEITNYILDNYNKIDEDKYLYYEFYSN